MILSICAKCSDQCSIIAKDKDGKVLVERDDYVPDLPWLSVPSSGGDYIEFDLDTDTGKIVGHKKLSDKTILKRLKEGINHLDTL